MIMLTADTATKIRRRLWAEEWADRLHAADSVVLWIRAREQTAPPHDRRHISRRLEQLTDRLQSARDHFFIARSAPDTPPDRWLDEARDCEQAYGDFVRDSNRALARFK